MRIGFFSELRHTYFFHLLYYSEGTAIKNIIGGKNK